MKIVKWLAAGCLIAPAYAANVPGQFDYYVLAMSWSPDYCAQRPDDREQCSRQFGFVLHGLWPQYERGFPADCSRERLQDGIMQQFAGLYPSRKLYRHEWEKHGTCSGLSQTGFHQLAASLKAKLAIPVAYQAPAQPLRLTGAQLKSDLAKANAWLKTDSLALDCSGGGRFLQEVRVCVDKQGKAARACSADVLAAERRSCRQPDFLLRSVR